MTKTKTSMPKTSKHKTKISNQPLTGCTLVSSLLWIVPPPPATRIRRRVGETPWAFKLREREHRAAARKAPPLRFSAMQDHDGMWRGLPITGPVEDHKHGDIIEHSSFEALRVDVEARYPGGNWIGSSHMVWPVSWGSLALFYTGRWQATALLHNEPFPVPFRFIPPHAHIDIGIFSRIEQAMTAALNFVPPKTWQDCSCVEPQPPAEPWEWKAEPQPKVKPLAGLLKKPKRCPHWNGKGTHNRKCPLCQGSGVAEAQ